MRTRLQTFEGTKEMPVTSSRTAGAEATSLIGVDYLRLKTRDGGDLYLTPFGVPLREQLDPENWYEPEWFCAKRTRLMGTSAIYKVPTKPVYGVSLSLVVRFSRVGEEVPIDTRTRRNHIRAEFNSPFEEFARVMELRAACRMSRPRMFNKKPLAIYAPPERLQLWQTGRLESKIAAKRAEHPDVELDILRQYILLYGWIKGLDAAQVADVLGEADGRRGWFLTEMTTRAVRDLAQHGFRMLDVKPQHILLRLRPDGSLLRRRDGQPAYALLDYELLERIPGPGYSTHTPTLHSYE